MSKPTFSNKLGFVLSAAGSAVGLGNIWRFPYLAAEYGGGIFLLVYIIVTLLFGFPIMSMEIAIGRKTASSSIDAYGKLDRRGGFIGIITVLVTLITVPYYCVIGGWVLKYAVLFCTGDASLTAQQGFFSEYTARPIEPIIFQLLFLSAAAVVLLLGVRSGIEKANRFLMPALIILAVVVAVYVLMLDGAMDGVMYYLKPDLSAFSFRTVLAATGQMFYSLSLASGIMITYGAYMRKDDSIESSVKQIELFDLGVAFLSGLIVISAVFAVSGGAPTALTAGPGLIFETLPEVFSALPLGDFIGSVFFILVFFAALSSAISMMEVNVANLIHHFGLSRGVSVVIMAAVFFLLGLPSALGYSIWNSIRLFGKVILDFMDTLGNSVITPLVALISCIFIGWVIGPRVLSDEIAGNGIFKRRRSFEFIVKWIAPVFITAVFIGSILGL